jgi:hypothetical protein
LRRDGPAPDPGAYRTCLDPYSAGRVKKMDVPGRDGHPDMCPGRKIQLVLGQHANEARNQPQKCGFAAARRPKDDDKLAVKDIKVDPSMIVVLLQDLPTLRMLMSANWDLICRC